MERNLKEIFHIVPQNILNIIPTKKSYLVGGAVRDFLLKKPFFDFDFILPDDDFSSLEYTLGKEQLKFILLNKKEFPLYRVFFDSFTFDFTSYDDLENDMHKRDFTINAIYVNFESGETFSHKFSFLDLENRILRVCSVDSIERDPVRFMRAFRFIAQHGLSVEETTRAIIEKSIKLYSTSKRERARNELKHLLQNDVDVIESSIRSIYPDFEISDKFRVKIAEHYKVFSTKISKDMDYLSLLKAFLIYKQFKEFVYGLTDREMSIIKYLEKGIKEDFDEFFEQYYLKRNKRIEFMLNIVANVPSNKVEKFLETAEQFNMVKLKEDEVKDFAKSQEVKIGELYKYYLKEKLKPIYENICNS